MTRINFGIPPEKLTDQHLLAEIRELPRIPRAVKKRLAEGKEVKTIDGPFRLGSGHVTWFNDKMEYLHCRYGLLFLEAERRKFSVSFDQYLFHIMECESQDDQLIEMYYNNAMPSNQDIALVVDRISQIITESNQIPRLNRQPIDKEEYINFLKSQLEWKTSR